METNSIQVTVESFPSNFIGLQVWGVVAGKGSGSHLSIKIGNKIKRKKPLINEYLSDMVREYESEWGVFIQNASWRLMRNQTVLCTSKTENTIEMPSAIAELLLKKIIDFTIDSRSFDMTITLENELVLDVFPDCFYYEDGENYSIFGPSGTLTIGAGCIPERE